MYEIRDSASGNFRRKRHVRDIRNWSRIFTLPRQGNLVSSVPFGYLKILFFLFPQVTHGRRTFRTIGGPGLRARVRDQRGLRPSLSDLSLLHLRARVLRPKQPAIGRIRMRVQTLTAFHWRTLPSLLPSSLSLSPGTTLSGYSPVPRRFFNPWTTPAHNLPLHDGTRSARSGCQLARIFASRLLFCSIWLVALFRAGRCSRANEMLFRMIGGGVDFRMWDSRFCDALCCVETNARDLPFRCNS